MTSTTHRSLNRASVLVAAAVFGLGAHTASAQDLSRYRGFTLESSLASVVMTSNTRVAEARTLHDRPAKIQELEWRTPYSSAAGEAADPVHGALFTFYDDTLYQIVVNYDRNRMDGLTNGDIVASLTSVYGDPVLRSARQRPAVALPDTVVLAQWDSPASSLTLLRGTYSSEYQLVLYSKVTGPRARTAIRAAERLDILEAPRRELNQRKKEAADATAANDKARAQNKSAFRP